MVAHRFIITWLLVVGLVAVYAQELEDDAFEQFFDSSVDSSNDLEMIESKSAPKWSHQDGIVEFVNRARLQKRSSGPGMSKEELDWHMKHGEEVLRRASQETEAEKRRRFGGKQEMEVQRSAPSTSPVNKRPIVILEARPPTWKANKHSGPAKHQ